MFHVPQYFERKFQFAEYFIFVGRGASVELFSFHSELSYGWKGYRMELKDSRIDN